MTNIVWLLLIVGYGLFTWAAEKRDLARAALCFLDGGYLAFLCFSVLPHGMDNMYFFRAAVMAGVGVLSAVWLEKKVKLQWPVFVIVIGCQVFWSGVLSLREVLFLSYFGGMGLYHASAGIIPEKEEIGKALLSASGFLIGTILFANF